MNQYYVVSTNKNFFVYANDETEAYYEADAYLGYTPEHLEVFLDEIFVWQNKNCMKNTCQTVHYTAVTVDVNNLDSVVVKKIISKHSLRCLKKTN